MKINCVYDIIGPLRFIPNAISSSHFKFFKKFDYNTNEHVLDDDNNQLSYWDVGAIGALELDNISISEIPKIPNLSDIYLYPVSTNGNYYKSLGLDDSNTSTFFENLSNRIIKLLKENENFYLYYEQNGEPYFDSDILKKIYDDCIEFGISISKLIIVNGTNSNDLILEDFREKYGIQDTINLITFNWPIPFKALELRSRLNLEPNDMSKNSTISDISHINLNKSHKGLFLNRRLRYHRLLSLALLEENGTLDKLMYSLDMNLNFYDNFKETLLHKSDTMPPVLIKNEEIQNKLLNGYDKLIQINKKTLDFENLSEVHGYGMETKELYEKTFFSIVSETEFSVFVQSFTEKLIKPMMHFHPFFVIGSPYTLQHLKKYGFKTFDKWWDESYDLIENDEDRLISVLGEIERISNLSNDELSKMLNEMRDVLIHNNEILISYDKDKLKKVLGRNLKSILKYNHNYLL